MFGLRQFSNGVHRGNFHLLGDGGCTAVEGTPENIGEAQDIVDLVGIVGAACCHDGIVAHGFDIFRQNFWIGIGQSKDQWLGCHFLHHVLLEHATGGQSQEHIGTLNGFCQGTLRCFLGELNFVFVHQLGSAFVHQTRQVSDPNVFARNAQFDQQTQAGQSRCTRARSDQLDLAGIFAHHFQAIQNGCTHGNGRAVLIVVKDWDLHAFAQLALDVETVWRFDVF